MHSTWKEKVRVIKKKLGFRYTAKTVSVSLTKEASPFC